jgi:hypothetical protein
MHRRISLVLAGAIALAAAPYVYGQGPPFPNVPIAHLMDESVTTTNTTGNPQGAWTVTFEGDEDPDAAGAKISGGHATTGGSVSHPEGYTDMVLTFSPSVVNNETVTFAWNMGDTDWKIAEHYFSGDKIGPSNSWMATATEDFQNLLYRLDNNAGPNTILKLGGASGSTVISDIGYRFTDARLALDELSYDHVYALGVTPISGTFVLAPGEEMGLPVLPVPPGQTISQLIYRVRWDGAGSDFPDAWMATQVDVPEPATLTLLVLGCCALLRRR